MYAPMKSPLSYTRLASESKMEKDLRVHTMATYTKKNTSKEFSYGSNVNCVGFPILITSINVTAKKRVYGSNVNSVGFPILITSITECHGIYSWYICMVCMIYTPVSNPFGILKNVFYGFSLVFKGYSDIQNIPTYVYYVAIMFRTFLRTSTVWP